jgi:hypothetical protein
MQRHQQKGLQLISCGIPSTATSGVQTQSILFVDRQRNKEREREREREKESNST